MPNLNPQEKFIADLLQTLNKNGFPSKKVALPLEKMYEIAHQKGLNFNKILAELETQDIMAEKSTQRGIFSPKKEMASAAPLGFDPSVFAGLDPTQMMEKVQEVLKTMTPEQMDAVKKTFDNLSAEEKADILKKGKEMGAV